jgi:Cu(I)/Ag(I) efflux system membrane protein CusA/SilA
MPIINRIDMLTTGIRSEVGVKVYGNDLTASRSPRDAWPMWCVDTGASNVYPNR